MMKRGKAAECDWVKRKEKEEVKNSEEFFNRAKFKFNTHPISCVQFFNHICVLLTTCHNNNNIKPTANVKLHRAAGGRGSSTPEHKRLQKGGKHVSILPTEKTLEDAACRSLIAQHTGEKLKISVYEHATALSMAKQRPAHAGLPVLSALTQCLRHRVLIGRFHLAVCPALHTAPQDIRAPMTSCVGRFRRDQRTRKD